MKEVHKNLPVLEFNRPATGLLELEVCNKSGLLPDPGGYCGTEVKKEIFIKGTEPGDYCHIHKAESVLRELQRKYLRDALLFDSQPFIDLSEIPDESETDAIIEEEEDAIITSDYNNFMDEEDYEDVEYESEDDTADEADPDVSDYNPLLDG